MVRSYRGKERRACLRFECKKPLSYNIIHPTDKTDKLSNFIRGISKNLSASGMLFITNAQENIPKVLNILAFELDYRTVSICQDIENRAVIINNKLLGKVMRVEDNGDGTFGIGVAFVTKADPLPEDVRELAM